MHRGEKKKKNLIIILQLKEEEFSVRIDQYSQINTQKKVWVSKENRILVLAIDGVKQEVANSKELRGERMKKKRN